MAEEEVRMFVVFLCFGFLATISSSPILISNVKPVSPVVVEEQLLWLSGGGEGEVDIYRTPLLVSTPQGSLLALCGARKYSSGDAGPKFLAIRRSTDKGQTWSPTDFVADDRSPDGINAGSIFVDETTSTIFVMYIQCAHHYKCNVSTLFLINSTDDGLTWSHPRNISEQIGTMTFDPGPGYGVQKKLDPYKGRLIVCGHGDLLHGGVYCLLSDDHGNRWRYGGTRKAIPYDQKKKAGDFAPDENQPLELPDGSILLNARNEYTYHCHCRVIMRSFDGAESFPLDYLRFDEKLIEPRAMASQWYSNGVLFFSNPAHKTKRINLTLRWSYDNGTTWASSLTIWPQASGYSAMTMLSEDSGHLYILYEKGVKSSVESLSLAKVALYGGL
ncbi:sialidase-1-like isoform X1 [Branchiostoma floridae]|uniref:Sialidase-1 n=1 Tax=Branchiostoma floridae TaxID=7739 RepID=A0A9J7LLH7_BRAFL|nr:sialidase-1-like isoform X1 [Branchiostoma floridae]